MRALDDEIDQFYIYKSIDFDICSCAHRIHVEKYLVQDFSFALPNMSPGVPERVPVFRLDFRYRVRKKV